MDHKQRNQSREQRIQLPVLYVAFELANSTWKLACSDGSRLRHVTVTAGDLDQVQGAILGARRHFGLDVRTLAIEIAWAWLRYQPQSKLSRWFPERFAGGGSRMRRIALWLWPGDYSSICGVFWNKGWSPKVPR